jgi:Fe-S oxidoreductase
LFSEFHEELFLSQCCPGVPAARELAERTFTLSEFLEKGSKGFRPPRLNRKALVQGHCHHKAIMGPDYRILESGCYGMAGSFAFEKETFDVSIACAERVLLPEVRKAGDATLILANGFSCREQIGQQTTQRTLHLVEVLQLAMRECSKGPGLGAP